MTFNVTCPTDAGVGGIQLAYGTSAAPTNRTSCANQSVTLATPDGTKTGYVRFKDALSNTTSDTTDTIILDQTNPSLVLLTPANGAYLS